MSVSTPILTLNGSAAAAPQAKAMANIGNARITLNVLLRFV